MNIIGVNGSPKKVGNSSTLLKYFERELTSRGNVFTSFYLADMTAEYCLGCLLCEDESRCPIVDDVAPLLEKLKDCDAIVLATPAYFDAVPGKLKTVIDRMNLITSDLKGKKLICVIVGQADEVSWKSVEGYIKTFCDIVGIEFLGCEAFLARKPGDLVLGVNNMPKLLGLVDVLVK